jgi:outer membrane protein X
MKTSLRIAMVAVALLIGGFSAYAQEMAVGGNIGVAVDKDVALHGIGVKFRYTLPEMSFGKIRGEGTFGYYFNNYSDLWDMSANVHYLIDLPSAPKFTLYPLAGLSLERYHESRRIDFDLGNYINPETGLIETTGSYRVRYLEFGINMGGGADYKITDRISINAELKYRLGTSGFSRFAISTGIVFRF